MFLVLFRGDDRITRARHSNLRWSYPVIYPTINHMIPKPSFSTFSSYILLSLSLFFLEALRLSLFPGSPDIIAIENHTKSTSLITRLFPLFPHCFHTSYTKCICIPGVSHKVPFFFFFGFFFSPIIWQVWDDPYPGNAKRMKRGGKGKG